MPSLRTYLSWLWPSIIALGLLALTVVLPGGPETVVLLGLAGLQAIVVFLKTIGWIVAEVRARSAQNS